MYLLGFCGKRTLNSFEKRAPTKAPGSTPTVTAKVCVNSPDSPALPAHPPMSLIPIASGGGMLRVVIIAFDQRASSPVTPHGMCVIYMNTPMQPNTAPPTTAGQPLMNTDCQMADSFSVHVSLGVSLEGMLGMDNPDLASHHRINRNTPRSAAMVSAALPP